MAVRVACLSPYDETEIRAMFQGEHDVEVVLVPPPPAQAAVLAACKEAHLVIGDRRHRHRIDRDVLAGMANCMLIQQAAVGFDSIDHRAAADHGIPVANAAGYNRDAVADWTVMAMIALLRRSFWLDRQLRAGRWSDADPMRDAGSMGGRELGAMTVGIVGMGNVGSAVANRVAAFGSRILFADALSRTHPNATQVSLEGLLEESDLVSIHAPLDVDTRRLIGRDSISKMKRGSYLVNASRGPIVDESALVEALRAGQLAGAALDVFEIEPLPTDSPLRALDNVILAPHRGGATAEADERLIAVVGDNLRRALDGRPLLNVVNGVTAVRVP
jgi:phosphoglycerate dehydrogenase-like enzyme